MIPRELLLSDILREWPIRHIWRFGLGVILLIATSNALDAGPDPAVEPLSVPALIPAVTNLAQVRHWAFVAGGTNLIISVEGVVEGVFPELSLVILHDATGNAGIKLDSKRFPGLKAKKRVRIKGLAHFGGGEASLQPPLVVDNDGLHSLQVVSGEMYLTKGLHPICLKYFQLARGFGLKVEYEGPGIQRKSLSREVLFHDVNRDGLETKNEPGLEYDYFEGAWNGMPDFNQLMPNHSGITDDFRLDGRTRDVNFAFQFNGLLKIEQSGRYIFHLSSDDGGQLFLQEIPTVVNILNQATEAEPRTVQTLTIAQPITPDMNFICSVVEGTIGFIGHNGKDWDLEIRSGDARMKLVISGTANLPTGFANNCQIRAMGFCQAAIDRQGQPVAGTLLVANTNDIVLLDSSANGRNSSNNPAETLPMLTTAEQVLHLKPEEAARGYPVRLRGVITARRIIPEGIIQDYTSALYVRFNSPETQHLKAGDYCEVAGVTGQGGFANLVLMNQVTHLGAGKYPELQHPDYAQLAGGSMDCQWVELQGMVSSIMDERRFQLIVKGGYVMTEIQGNADLSILAGLSNAFVRVRGCVIPGRNEMGQVTKEVFFWIPSTDCINVDRVPPADPFQVPLKQVSDLSLFDPNPNYHQTTKVRGQILLVSDSMLYFTDGINSLRILPKNAPPLVAGDLVEAVGLPDLFGNPPMLIEATIRKTGHTNLPNPPVVDLAQISQPENTGRRVRIEGQLIDARAGYKQAVLVIQSGLRNIQASGSINAPDATLPPLGSQVTLCGVVRNAQQNESGNAGGTELLFDSPSDITCLELPPFWTPRRVLLLLSILSGTVLLAAVWIYILRRTVSKRTEALRLEMSERQNAEEKVRALDTLRALETERARISRNIHDDLGARVTKLSRLASQITVIEPDSQARLDEITSTSRQMVEALDETVWTVNPVNDSLPKLANYISHYAEDFFHDTDVRCELDIPLNLPELTVTAEFRFNLFLAVKEALNNVLKHADAQSVLLKLVHLPGRLQLTILDDGRGFAPETDLRRSGLANLQTRLAGLGGQFTFKSAPDTGTSVFITVPLPDLTVQPAQTA